MTQKEIFLEKEWDMRFDRNQEKVRSKDDDIIINYFKENIENPLNILEIGCSDWRRLNKLYETYKCKCYGIDPSTQAIKSGKKNYKILDLTIWTADKLPYENNSFDNIIIGFCLYLCDRKDLFKIAYEVDRVLKNGWNLFILDFYSDFWFKNKYIHREWLYSYKMNYAKLFDRNPSYNTAYMKIFSHANNKYIEHPNEKVCLRVMKKSEERWFIDNPFNW